MRIGRQKEKYLRSGSQVDSEMRNPTLETLLRVAAAHEIELAAYSVGRAMYPLGAKSDAFVKFLQSV